MCRFFALFSDSATPAQRWLTEAPNALVKQARLCGQGKCHGDGWGMACYNGREPRVVRSTVAAFDDPQFVEAASGMRGTTVMAHVRRASVGAADPLNNHPFVHGPWAFMHNGTAEGFDRVQPQLLEETLPGLRASIRGTTDSEAIFYWLLSHLAAAGSDLESSTIDPQPAARIVARQAARLAAWCDCVPSEQETRLNFVLTNGRILVATRWCQSMHHLLPGEGTSDSRVWLLASEPVDEQPWQEVPNYHVVWNDRGLRPSIAAI